MAQIVVALLITLAACQYNSMTRPFVDPALDKLQIFALATQVMPLQSSSLPLAPGVGANCGLEFFCKTPFFLPRIG